MMMMLIVTQAMFVGGPNSRLDYHVEVAEEFFFQLRGDMCLEVVEQGRPRPLRIAQGHCFMLPPRIPHSPQRLANTLGFVMERKRTGEEMDCMRWYVRDQGVQGALVEPPQVLWEEWVAMRSLASDMPPVMRKFAESQAAQEGVPAGEWMERVDQRPLLDDVETQLEEPLCLQDFLAEQDLTTGQPIRMFDQGHFKVWILGEGSISITESAPEFFCWQLQGAGAVVSLEPEAGRKIALEKEFDTVLVHSSAGVRVENPPGGVTMVLFVVQVQD